MIRIPNQVAFHDVAVFLSCEKVGEPVSTIPASKPMSQKPPDWRCVLIIPDYFFTKNQWETSGIR